MLFTDVISKKRDGHALSEADIAFFVAGLADGSLPAEQVSALAMAIYLRSMDFEEAALLTRHMAHSGNVLEWPADEIDGPVIDKHSTGGVGDKVSLVLAPIAAACGCFVPMISGRGLGHTGGTLDKMESIPGYCTTPDLARFKAVVRRAGCAIIGQTPDLAPADRRLYAIRDVTATVESIPLITASILSKKIAAGNRGLVLDVKTGSGAFMTTLERARALAESIVATANAAGLTTHALITDMNETLGTTAGNALEVAEAVAYLNGEKTDRRFEDVSIALCAEMLVLSGLSSGHADAAARAREAVSSGKAAEVFAFMVSELGGPTDFMRRAQDYLPVADVCQPVMPSTPGYVSHVDTRAIGNAIIELGGGRRQASDELDLSVGFSAIAGICVQVDRDTPLALVHAATREAADSAADAMRRAVTVNPTASAVAPVVHASLRQVDGKLRFREF